MRQSIDFYLDEKIRDTLHEKKIDEINEIEFRFGTIVNQKVGITFLQYEYIQNFLNLQQTLKKKIEKSTVEIDKNGYRKISIIGKNSFFEKKTKVENIDTVYQNFNLRLSFSTEEKVQPPLYFNTKLRRERDRVEYLNDDYTYVLTKISENGIPKYEFEIEFIKFPTIQIAEKSIGFILGTFVYISDYSISYIPISLINYLSNKYKEIVKTYSFKEVKPINLTREETPFLDYKKFSVTNKLDGEHFFCIFCDEGVFAINNRIFI